MPTNDDLQFRLVGAEQLAEALRDLPQKLRTNAISKKLRDSLKPIKARARALAPVLKKPKRGRKPGTLKKAISIRTSKTARREGNLGAFVNVRPLNKNKISAFKRAGGGAGAMNPDDPYYWRFVEFGHKIVPPKPKGVVGTLFGVTTYTQRLRNGKVVTRTRKYNRQSITGRRHGATGRVAPKPFLQPAAKLLAQSGQLFIDDLTKAIQKLDRERGA